jgi:non-ribosomal peptide synthetase component E (peptide arylation enzyme)
VLQLSGGTTGTPKIIPRLHAEYRCNADLTASWWGHTERSVLAFGLPLAHNAALANGLHAAHGAGAALLLATPAADVMLPLMAQHGATWTMSPPGLAREYLSHPAFDHAVARLGTWVLTAARVPRPVFDELTGRGVHVTQAFGMSEGLFLFTPLDAPAELRAETVGVPISPLDEVRVLRPGTDVEVAEGETGELAARGPYTIRGYLDAPDRDREAFTAEGFYRSGDLVRAHRYAGTLSYSIEGRIKDLIDRGGEKINAEEVELLIAGHPAVAEIALVGMPDPRLGERGCAYVVPRDPQNPPTLAGICVYLEAEGLAKYKWPERLELTDALPRTQIGKVSKAELRKDITQKLSAKEGSLPEPPTAAPVTTTSESTLSEPRGEHIHPNRPELEPLTWPFTESPGSSISRTPFASKGSLYQRLENGADVSCRSSSEDLVHDLGALDQDRAEFLAVNDLRRARTRMARQPGDLLHRHAGS